MFTPGESYTSQTGIVDVKVFFLINDRIIEMRKLDNGSSTSHQQSFFKITMDDQGAAQNLINSFKYCLKMKKKNLGC